MFLSNFWKRKNVTFFKKKQIVKDSLSPPSGRRIAAEKNLHHFSAFFLQGYNMLKRAQNRIGAISYQLAPVIHLVWSVKSRHSCQHLNCGTYRWIVTKISNDAQHTSSNELVVNLLIDASNANKATRRLPSRSLISYLPICWQKT